MTLLKLALLRTLAFLRTIRFIVPLMAIGILGYVPGLINYPEVTVLAMTIGNLLITVGVIISVAYYVVRRSPSRGLLGSFILPDVYMILSQPLTIRNTYLIVALSNVFTMLIMYSWIYILEPILVAIFARELLFTLHVLSIITLILSIELVALAHTFGTVRKTAVMVVLALAGLFVTCGVVYTSLTWLEVKVTYLSLLVLTVFTCPHLVTLSPQCLASCYTVPLVIFLAVSVYTLARSPRDYDYTTLILLCERSLMHKPMVHTPRVSLRVFTWRHYAVRDFSTLDSSICTIIDFRTLAHRISLLFTIGLSTILLLLVVFNLEGENFVIAHVLTCTFMLITQYMFVERSSVKLSPLLWLFLTSPYTLGQIVRTVLKPYFRLCTKCILGALLASLIMYSLTNRALFAAYVFSTFTAVALLIPITALIHVVYVYRALMKYTTGVTTIEDLMLVEPYVLEKQKFALLYILSFLIIYGISMLAIMLPIVLLGLQNINVKTVEFSLVLRYFIVSNVMILAVLTTLLMLLVRYLERKLVT